MKSDGNYVDAIRNIPVVARFLDRIESEQRKLSGIFERLKVGEKVEKLLKRKRKTVGVLHRELADFVRDFLHKLSINIVRDNDLVIVEDLKIKNMTKSAKGTIEDPGKNVAQKSGLNRNLLSNRISMFFGMLECKCRWYGRTFVKVDPKYTSQRCSVGGYIHKDNRPDQARFKCLLCGNEMNADYNAATNILMSGLLKNPEYLNSGTGVCAA